MELTLYQVNAVLVRKAVKYLGVKLNSISDKCLSNEDIDEPEGKQIISIDHIVSSQYIIVLCAFSIRGKIINHLSVRKHRKYGKVSLSGIFQKSFAKVTFTFAADCCCRMFRGGNGSFLYYT